LNPFDSGIAVKNLLEFFGSAGAHPQQALRGVIEWLE